LTGQELFSYAACQESGRLKKEADPKEHFVYFLAYEFQGYLDG